MIAVATGHGPMRHYLNKIEVEEDPTCRLCLEEEEAAEHSLCECEALAWNGLRLFSKPIAKPEDILKAEPNSLLSFTKSLRFLLDSVTIDPLGRGDYGSQRPCPR